MGTKDYDSRLAIRHLGLACDAHYFADNVFFLGDPADGDFSFFGHLLQTGNASFGCNVYLNRSNSHGVSLVNNKEGDGIAAFTAYAAELLGYSGDEEGCCLAGSRFAESLVHTEVMVRQLDRSVLAGAVYVNSETDFGHYFQGTRQSLDELRKRKDTIVINDILGTIKKMLRAAPLDKHEYTAEGATRSVVH